jgi:hypothetical protein
MLFDSEWITLIKRLMIKIFKILILLQLALNYTAGYSQDNNMNKEVEEIVLLGKDSIVQLALKLIDEKAGMRNFTEIKVMTNGKEVYVSFRNPIKYLPIKSVFYFDVRVSLFEKITSYGPVFNGTVEYDKMNIPFYKETKETKMNIQFVIEAINKSAEVGSIDMANFDDNLIISEYENYYDIRVVSEFQESSYKIEKISGKISDAEHAHLVPPPFDIKNKDILKEIN